MGLDQIKRLLHSKESQQKKKNSKAIYGMGKKNFKPHIQQRINIQNSQRIHTT